MASSNLTSFAGQVVLVTGAASGIGKAAAELIAERGGHVVCLDLNEAGLKTTVSEISAAEKWSKIFSISILRNATFCMLFSMAVFAPRHILEPFISIPMKFLSGYFSARLTVYSPLPQPNSNTIGWLFLK